jgi:hypothetical protein
MHFVVLRGVVWASTAEDLDEWWALVAKVSRCCIRQDLWESTPQRKRLPHSCVYFHLHLLTLRPAFWASADIALFSDGRIRSWLEATWIV